MQIVYYVRLGLLGVLDRLFNRKSLQMEWNETLVNFQRDVIAK